MFSLSIAHANSLFVISIGDTENIFCFILQSMDSMQELVCFCCLFKFYRVRLVKNIIRSVHARLLEVLTNNFAWVDENAWALNVTVNTTGERNWLLIKRIPIQTVCKFQSRSSHGVMIESCVGWFTSQRVKTSELALFLAWASGFHKRHLKSVIKSKYHLWRLVKETINFDKTNTDSQGMQISAEKLTRWWSRVVLSRVLFHLRPDFPLA